MSWRFLRFTGKLNTITESERSICCRTATVPNALSFTSLLLRVPKERFSLRLKTIILILLFPHANYIFHMEQIYSDFCCEVPDLNLGLDTDCLDWFNFRGFINNSRQILERTSNSATTSSTSFPDNVYSYSVIRLYTFRITAWGGGNVQQTKYVSSLCKHPHNITYVIIIFSLSLVLFFERALPSCLLLSDVILVSTWSIY